MKSGIVFINQATGYLAIDIINAFAGSFERVLLLTGSVRVQNTTLDSRVEVKYISRYDRGTTFRKAGSWIMASIQLFFILKLSYRSFDKFFFTIPPTAYLMAPWFKGKYSILVFDLYPKALTVKGFREGGLLCKWWAKRNKKVFMNSHRIYTLSEAMKSGIQEYAPGIDVKVIPNWSAFSHIIPVRKGDNKILNREGLQGKFIVQYSGNIGATHNVEALIQVAEYLQENKEIVFQIIGRGAKSNEIARLIIEKGLLNCMVLPFRNEIEFYESLCASDLAVIILDGRTPDISIPSKIYNIMAAGLPVMAIAHPESGLAEIISGHNIGKVFEKHDINGMMQFVLELKNNNDLKNLYSARSLQTSTLYTSNNAELYVRFYMEQNSDNRR